MPIYEYAVLDSAQGPCPRCGPRRSELQRMSDEPLAQCGECGRPLLRVMSRSVARKDPLTPSNLRDKGFRTLRKDDSGKYVEDPGYRPKGYADEP